MEMKFKVNGIALIAIAFFLYFLALMSILKHQNAAFAMGQFLGALVLPIGIVKFITRNKSEEAKNKAMFVIGLIANLLVAIFVFTEWNSQNQLAKTLNSISVGDDGRLTTNIDLDKSVSKKSEIHMPGFTPSNYNTIDELLKLTLEVSKKYQARFDANNKAIEQVGIDTVLNANIFTDKNENQKSEQKLVKIDSLLKQQVTIMEEMFIAQKEAVDSSSASEKLKSEYYAGVKKGNQDARELLLEQQKAAKMMLANMKSILVLANKNMGKTIIQNGVIDFGTNSDNQSYNTALKNIEFAAQEEERIMNKRIANQKSLVEKMQKEVR